MKTERKISRHIRNDIILVAVVLLIAFIGGIYLFCFRAEGNTVTVTVDGEYFGEYSLSEDMEEYIYSGENNAQYNHLVIREGKAFVDKASCPDGICSDHSAIFRDGESIICLPNKVVVTVNSRVSDDAPDAVA